MISTACHCGRVRIAVPRKPSSLTECNCSICLRYGALWAYYAHAEVEVLTDSAATCGYSWGTGALVFHHCRVCGCVSHYETNPADPGSVFALNARVMWPELREQVHIRPFDGADSWQYLDE